jgi:hypothetical protein
MLARMFGVRTSQVFTSRWKALLWAAGVLMTAYCTVPDADEDAPAPGTAAAKPGQHDLDAQKALDTLRGLHDR